MVVSDDGEVRSRTAGDSSFYHSAVSLSSHEPSPQTPLDRSRSSSVKHPARRHGRGLVAD